MQIQANSIACFYYPTMVALVDDSSAFLSNVRLKLASCFATGLYQSPDEALQDLLDNNKLLFSGDKLLNIKDNPEFNREQNLLKVVNVNIQNIYKQIYNPKRFFDITTLLVDYSMPIMNGMEFCERLKNYKVRKLMLTGMATNDIAVAGFNNKLIDKFLLKDGENTSAEIINEINQEQAAYFYNASKTLLEVIGKSGNYILHNDMFKDVFYRLCKAANACEYYLLDLSGSFLLLDAVANPTFLLIKSESELETYYQIAKDNDAPQSILGPLKNRQKLLFLLTEADAKVSPQQWEQNLYPATMLDNGKYYYSIVNGPIKGLDFTKVLSYRSFLKSL